MKLAALTFDDTVTIYAGKDVGGGLSRQDLRDSSFRAEDGWELEMDAPGLFRISRAGMPAPVMVSGYGWSAVAEPASQAPPEMSKKGRR